MQWNVADYTTRSSLVPFWTGLFKAPLSDCHTLLQLCVAGVLLHGQRHHRPYQQHKQVANASMTTVDPHGPLYSPFYNVLCGRHDLQIKNHDQLISINCDGIKLIAKQTWWWQTPSLQYMKELPQTHGIHFYSAICRSVELLAGLNICGCNFRDDNVYQCRKPTVLLLSQSEQAIHTTWLL